MDVLVNWNIPTPPQTIHRAHLYRILHPISISAQSQQIYIKQLEYCQNPELKRVEQSRTTRSGSIIGKINQATNHQNHHTTV